MSKVSKVKISLASGNFVEKPVVTCFKGNNATYLILDNEANGQMGYPIICISRLNNNVLEKITDQGEWTSVKESLKTIISGTSPAYVSVPEGLTAQDDFFTQLTLPVASFDLLKNAYVVPEPVQEMAPMPEVAPAVPTEPAPIEAPQDVIAPAPMPSINEPTVLSASPVLGTIEPPAATVEQPIESPVIAPLPVTPEMTPPMPEPLPVNSQEPLPTPTPLANDIPVSTSGSEIQALKESFMKSCENMFDALIKKFENK